MTDPALAKLFQQIPIFAGLTEEECRLLTEIATTVDFQAGQEIVHQGADEHDLWILLDGRCQVVIQSDSQSNSSETTVLDDIEPYCQFGEMSFFQPAPRSATVRALVQSKLLTIRRADFDALVERDSRAAYKLACNTINSLADRLRSMDKFVAESLCHCDDPTIKQTPEWTRLREKVFEGWIL